MIEGPLTGVWGWPWHGLASANIIQPSGKSIDQPQHCHAWLIDIGLPAITLTAAEEASATANDYEWRNYALISGGRVYDTALPAESFIHVDTDNKCWLIILSYTYTAENQVNITATIKRFGLFGYGELGTVTKTDSATCTHIELTAALGNPIGTYSARVISLSDVWTNGAKVLVDVKLATLSPSYYVDLLSVIEIEITGAGGSDGSGLSISATEIKGQYDLTFAYDSGSLPPPSNPFCNGLNWVASSTYQYYLPNNRTIYASYAKESFYDSAGAARALGIRFDSIQGIVTCEDAWQENSPTETCYIWETATTVPTVETHLVAKVDDVISISITKDGVATDVLERTLTYYMHEWYTLCNGAFTSGLFIEYDYPSTDIYTGGLSDQFDADDGLHASDVSALAAGWRIEQASTAVTLASGKIFGVQHIDSKSAAFFIGGTSRTYGPVSTPLGNKTTALAPSEEIYFSWQRKTGDFSFSTSLICYV